MRKLFSFAVAALAALVGFGEMVSPTLFSKKCEFTVSGYAGSSTLSDFPVLVRLSAGSPSGFSYADCQTDGSDLRFADAAGNLLSHEIDTWDTAGESLIWVKVPSLVGKTTAVTCYYGANPVSLPAVDLHDTWTKYVTVIHGGTTIADSSVKKLTLTANAVTGTAAGENGGFVGGGMNKASRNTKGVNVPSPYKNNLLTNVRQYSISFWAKSPTKSDDGTHVTVCGVSAWNQGGMLGLFEKSHGWSVAVSAAHHYVDGKGKLPANTWTHTSFSYDTELGHYTSYSNGELIKAWTDSNKYTDSGTSYWTFGGYADTASGDNFYGDLDECRIYNGIASEDWLVAEYDSMADASFVTAGSVEDIVIPKYATVACVNTERTMYALGFNIVVTDFGEDATKCDLHVVLASDAAYANVLDTVDLTDAQVQLGTACSIGADGLDFGTSYYLKVEATNDNGETATVEKVFETLPAPPCSVTFGLEKGDSTFASFIWSLSGFGDASSYASVTVEWSTDDFATSASQEIVAQMDAPTGSTRVVVRELTPGQAYSFRLKTVNECGTVGYSDPVAVTAPTKAASTMIWANTGTDMNAAESYVELRVPTKDDTIYFLDAPVVQPHLTDDLTVYAVHFDDLAHAAVTPACGYVISAEEGKTLTLKANYINQATQYAIHCWAYGTNTIEAAICLTGGKINLGGNGMTLILNGEVSTNPDNVGNQEMYVSGSSSSGHDAKIVFGHANPDLHPKFLEFDGQTYLAFTDKDAFCAVPEFRSNHWGGTPYTFFANESGEPAVWPSVTRFLFNGYGHNGFTFEGSPFIWENCLFEDPARNSKTRTVNTHLLVKKIRCTDYDNIKNGFMTFSGTGMIETLEGYEDDVGGSGRVYNLQVSNGAYYSHVGLQGGATTDRAVYLAGDSRYPVLAFDQDVSISSGFRAGAYSCQADKNMGFAGMGGEVEITVDGGNVMNYKDRTTEDSGKAPTPRNWVFGNKYATGTAVLMNEVSCSASSEIFLYGIQGEAYVAGRFAADVTSTQNKQLSKKGDGVVAFESACNFGNSYVWEGGLLFNGDCTGTPSWTAKGGAMIGGTGSCKSITIDGNATLRPGEFGGTLTVKEGSVSLETGAKVVIDIAADKHSCLAVEAEGSYYYKTPGANGATMEINLVDGAPASGKVKIMDWSKAKADSLTNLFDPSSYTLTYDEAKISEATLTRDNTEKALYLEYKAKEPGPAEDAGFMIYVL